MTSLARGPMGAEPLGSPPGRDAGTGAGRGTGRHGPSRAAGLPAVWLRANCPCADCLDPGSGQRPAAITDLPTDVTVAGGPGIGRRRVEVIFGPDGHRAVFAVTGWLARYGDPGGEAGTGAEPGPRAG